MVVLQYNTESDSSATETGDEQSESSKSDPSPSGGVLSRLVDAAETVATLVEPFSALLSAVVQAATVATLVRKA